MSMIIAKAKEFCWKRISAITTQFLILPVFLFLLCINLIRPIQWNVPIFSKFFSFFTLLRLCLLSIAMLIYGLVLLRSYLSTKKYYPTKWKYITRAGPMKLALLSAHVLIGFLVAWTYMKFLDGKYNSLYFQYFGANCLNCKTTFLTLAGIVAACHHFWKTSLREELEIEFPIIQETRLVKVRTAIYTQLWESLRKSLLPTLCFGLFYCFFGGIINRKLAALLQLEVFEEGSKFFQTLGDIRLLLYTWLLWTQVVAYLAILQRLQIIIFTEEVRFSIHRDSLEKKKERPIYITLCEGLACSAFPVVQNLAALDFYNIVTRKDKRLFKIFALSVPGGHPYNWRQLSSQCLGLIDNFTMELAQSTQTQSTQNQNYNPMKPTATEAAEKILLRQYNETHGIRRLQDGVGQLYDEKIRQMNRKNIEENFQKVTGKIKEKLWRIIPGLSYFFDEMEGAKTAYLLNNSQIIVWITQALARIAVLSLTKDKYGVVQVTLAEIIIKLLDLKRQLDRLPNVRQVDNQKTYANFNALKKAISRSLYQICTTFGDYLPNLIPNPEDLHALQPYINFQ